MATLSLEEVEGILREGPGYFEHVDAEELKDGATLKIRPLTRGESVKVRNKSMAGQKVSAPAGQQGGGTIEVDMAQAAAATEEADQLLLKFGLSVDEDWSDQSVNKLPEPLAARLIKRIKRISGDPVNAAADLERFRTDGAGGEVDQGDDDGDTSDE